MAVFSTIQSSYSADTVPDKLGQTPENWDTIARGLDRRIEKKTFRYTPQSNWGQSLAYHRSTEKQPYYASAASFEEIAEAMGKLMDEGKLRGWGMCNDNAYGLAASAAAARP